MVEINEIHTPVLLEECVQLLVPALDKPHSTIVDCTLGLAGHAEAVLHAAPQAHLIGIDKDAQALDLAARRLQRAGVADRFTPVHAAFDSFDDILDEQSVESVEAVFMDLGLSSLQIDERERGFSYSQDAPLDMRMNRDQELTASQILADYDQQSLTGIFRQYGEERYAAKIAREVVRRRNAAPITTSTQLNELVASVIPPAHKGSGNPAKRVFQALRIEVNGELDALKRTLPQVAVRLSVQGRLVVESYHSLEDRIVKSFMRQGTVVDVPAGLPVIPDDAQPYFRSLTNGAVMAQRDEVAHNPRSASVRLRAVELIRRIPTSRLNRLHDSMQHAGSSTGSPIASRVGLS